MKKTLGVLAIGAVALLLAVGSAVANADGDNEDPAHGFMKDGPLDVALLHPEIHAHQGGDVVFHIPTPPMEPEAARSGPVAGGGQDVMTGTVGSAIVGPRSGGSMYTPKQQADRKIRQLIRALD